MRQCVCQHGVLSLLTYAIQKLYECAEYIHWIRNHVVLSPLDRNFLSEVHDSARINWIQLNELARICGYANWFLITFINCHLILINTELLGDLLRQRPCETDGVESVVIVDNIPKVDPLRQEKLKTVIQKLFSTCGEIVNDFYPLDDEGNTKGYCFLEYKNPENAEEAVKNLNNHRLDRKFTFSVNLFTDFQKWVWFNIWMNSALAICICDNLSELALSPIYRFRYEHTPENWTVPTPQPYKVQNDLHTYLTEPDAYDQFCVAAETSPNCVQVQFWQNTVPEPTSLETRDVSKLYNDITVFSDGQWTRSNLWYPCIIWVTKCSRQVCVHDFPHKVTIDQKTKANIVEKRHRQQ